MPPALSQAAQIHTGRSLDKLRAFNTVPINCTQSPVKKLHAWCLCQQTNEYLVLLFHSLLSSNLSVLLYEKFPVWDCNVLKFTYDIETEEVT
jgi:hypothetical protein